MLMCKMRRVTGHNCLQFSLEFETLDSSLSPGLAPDNYEAAAFVQHHVIEISPKLQRGSEMAPWTALTIKPGDLVQTPGPIRWNDRTDFCKLFPNLHMCSVAHVHTQTHTLT